MVCVIKDQAGNYVSGDGTILLVDEGYIYISYTGRATGFSYFSDSEQMHKEKEKIQKLCNQCGFKKKFTIEYINDIQKIPVGKMIIKNLSFTNKKLVNL